MKTISDLLVEVLANAGVKRLWGITGDSLNGINDSLRRNGKIEWMHVRHEEAAAFAAGAEAAVTGELAVCAGSCGPGNLHLINGLFDCQRNYVPVLAIASHIPSSEIGLGYFQETHPQDLFKECSVFCELITNAAQLPEILFRALNTAVSEKGVSVLVIPGDVSMLPVEEKGEIYWHAPKTPKLLPNDEDIEQLAKELEDSEKITIFAGAGCANAHDEVVALAQKLQAPVVHALRGKEFLEWDNPCDVGMTGLIGFSSGYHAMENSDTLLILGTDFPYRAFYPKNAKILQVDKNAAVLGKRAPIKFGMIGDIKTTITALLPKLTKSRSSSFLEKSIQHYQEARKSLDDLAKSRADGEPLHPQYVAARANELAAEDAIFTADVGTPTVWAARYLKMNGKRRLLGSFNHGSMANAMVQAMGAQSVDKNRQIVSLSGDGGFSMLMGDLLTLKQMQLPVKVIVFNNGVLGFVAMEMKAAGYLDNAVGLENPNFAAMAEAVGIKGIRVNNSSELDDALRTAFAHPEAVVVDVRIDKQELIMPPKIELEQAKGFSLFMLKAILNGRGDEIMDLAKANWF